MPDPDKAAKESRMPDASPSRPGWQRGKPVLASVRRRVLPTLPCRPGNSGLLNILACLAKAWASPAPTPMQDTFEPGPPPLAEAGFRALAHFML